jgi:hypothetical protein
MASKLVITALTITADAARYDLNLVETKHKAIIATIVTHHDKFNSPSISVILSSEFTLFRLAK